MWIVRYALSHPYTIGALAVVILLVGGISTRKISTDILPSVDVPSINVVWSYPGLSASDMAAKITSFSENSLLNNLDDIREVRAESTDGVGIITVEFQPHVDIELAIAQVVGTSQTIVKRMPPGTLPPSIIRVNPSNTPILNLVVSSDTLNDGELYDYARTQLRSQVKSIPGLRMTLPYGGAPRQIMVELDPPRLQAHDLSAEHIQAAIASQSLTLPSGIIREGPRALRVMLNSSPADIAEFAMMPVKVVDGRAVLLRDVATVRDGPAVQSNLSRLDGNSAVVVSIIKLGNASTIELVRQIRDRLPMIQASAPEGMRVEAVFDQSGFVQSAARTVLLEAALVACLVAFVILMFIGSLRSTLIVLTSIPLALLCSVAGLYFAGHTFNLMSLGGLGLAIGVLVDNALVEIENINRRIESGEPVRDAILRGAGDVVLPEFLSTLCICIVFLPVFILTDVPAFIFKPLALAVVLAMVASFVLSRTLVPTLAYLLLPAEATARGTSLPHSRRGLARWQHAFAQGLDRWRRWHLHFLLRLRGRMGLVMAVYGGVILLGVLAALSLGREFFPRTDAGMIRFHVRAPAGLRLEETAAVFADVQREVRKLIPAHEIRMINEIIGQPEAVNMAWVPSTSLGPFDGEMLVQLKPGHAPTAQYQAQLRERLAQRYPQLTVFFRPADSTNLTLAGASPTDIDLRLSGKDLDGNRAAAAALMTRMRDIPGVVDVALRQVFDQPELYIEIDRIRALQLGITQEQAASAVLSVLGSGGSVSPSVWADRRAGTSYPVQVLAPPVALDSLDRVLNLPLMMDDAGRTITLRAITHVSERSSPATISRVMLLPSINILANVQGRDLGRVADELAPLIADAATQLAPGNRIELLGQAQLMDQAYRSLAIGLTLAIALVLLVQVINFQSWLLPITALSGLPLALSGCAVMLLLTGTPLSVPALMGMIMVVGVSAANSVLVVSFARDRMAEGMSAHDAALAATRTRFRPVLMTATAMIAGVIPMAIALGAGTEQNAPLGRAVIGGLVLGTLATLTIVPLLFAHMARAPARAPMPLAPLEDAGA